MATSLPPTERLDIEIDDTCSEIFFLIWLDSNPEETRQTEQELRSIINNLKRFEDINSCENFIKERSKNDRLIIIVSGRLGREIVPNINNLPQVISIYVYCMNKAENETWACSHQKVRAVITDLNELIDNVKDSHKIQKIVDEPFSYNTYSRGNSTSGVQGQFVFSQVLIDCLLRLQSSESDQEELIKLCKRRYEGNAAELENICEFEKEYTADKALWWYSRDSFFFKTLNATLRNEDIHMTYLFRRYIYDIYHQLKEGEKGKSFCVYRGQKINKDEINILKQNCGKFISVNAFFSTSTDKQVALNFLNRSKPTDDTEKVIFVIDIEPTTVSMTKPFANISATSCFANESEVLFMLGSIFRLKSIKRDKNDRKWILRMTWCDENQHELKVVLSKMKEQLGTGETNLRTLGKILCEMGKLDLSEKYFVRYLNQLPANSALLDTLYEDLAQVTSQKGAYDESVQWRKKAIESKRNLSIPANNIPITADSLSISFSIL